MPSVRAARRERPRRRAEEIIDAAAAVFAERGYHGASTQDVADRLGMRQASLYYYFPSKEAALEEVCLRSVGDFVERAQAIAAGSGAAADKLAAIVESHLAPVETRGDYVRCFLRERRFLPRDSARRIGRVAHQYESVLQGVIEAGITAGELRRDLDPRLTTLALIGMCNAAMEWYGREPNAPLGRIVGQFAALVIDGMRAARGAPPPSGNRAKGIGGRAGFRPRRRISG